jgi:hypothetical protein
MSKLPTHGFDYLTLSPNVRAVVAEKTSALHGLNVRHSETIITIGQVLAEIRAILPPKTFKSWLASEVGWKRSAAYNYIRVAEMVASHPDESAKFALLQATTLYALASRSVPKATRSGVLFFDQGEEMSDAGVRARLFNAMSANPEPTQKLEPGWDGVDLTLAQGKGPDEEDEADLTEEELEALEARAEEMRTREILARAEFFENPNAGMALLEEKKEELDLKEVEERRLALASALIAALDDKLAPFLATVDSMEARLDLYSVAELLSGMATIVKPAAEEQ